MSNVRYYARRNAGRCPECGALARPHVYCSACREFHAFRVSLGRSDNRAAYNAYMRNYKQKAEGSG